MFTEQLKAWFAYRIEYFTALFFVKISILAFYRRLTPAPEFQLAIKVVAAVVATFTMSMVLVIVRALCKTLPGPVDSFYANAVRETGKGL